MGYPAAITGVGISLVALCPLLSTPWWLGLGNLGLGVTLGALWASSAAPAAAAAATTPATAAPPPSRSGAPVRTHTSFRVPAAAPRREPRFGLPAWQALFSLRQELRVACVLASQRAPFPIVTLCLQEVTHGPVSGTPMPVISETEADAADTADARPEDPWVFRGDLVGTRALLTDLLATCCMHAGPGEVVHMAVRHELRGGRTQILVRCDRGTKCDLGPGRCLSASTAVNPCLLATAVAPSPRVGTVAPFAAHALQGRLVASGRLAPFVGAVVVSGDPATREALTGALVAAGLAEAHLWVLQGAAHMTEVMLEPVDSVVRTAPGLLIVLDLNLPDGDGHDLCAQARALGATAHFVAVVPGPAVDVTHAVLDHLAHVGFNSVLCRPLRPRHVEALVNALRAVLQPGP